VGRSLNATVPVRVLRTSSPARMCRAGRRGAGGCWRVCSLRVPSMINTDWTVRQRRPRCTFAGLAQITRKRSPRPNKTSPQSSLPITAPTPHRATTKANPRPWLQSLTLTGPFGPGWLAPGVRVNGWALGALRLPSQRCRQAWFCRKVTCGSLSLLGHRPSGVDTVGDRLRFGHPASPRFWRSPSTD